MRQGDRVRRRHLWRWRPPFTFMPRPEPALASNKNNTNNTWRRYIKQIAIKAKQGWEKNQDGTADSAEHWADCGLRSCDLTVIVALFTAFRQRLCSTLHMNSCSPRPPSGCSTQFKFNLIVDEFRGESSGKSFLWFHVQLYSKFLFGFLFDFYFTFLLLILWGALMGRAHAPGEPFDA